MNLFAALLIFLASFIVMEFMAWFTHKYIMHGFLWSLHKDHHLKDHGSWWERNDVFFIFYAAVSIGFFLLWRYGGFFPGLSIGLGIFAYGVTYFLVHDVLVHQRFKWFRGSKGWYARVILRAHQAHHKHMGKNDGECFGILLPPLQYFRQELKKQ